MSQDALIILFFKVVLVADLLSVFAFLVWWRHVTGRSIAIKDILLGLALLPSTLSLFFKFNRVRAIGEGCERRD